VQNLTVLLSNAGIAIVLFRETIFKYPIQIIFLILSLYLFYSSTFDPYLNNVMLAASRNGISWLMIVTCTLYYIINFNVSKSIPTLPAVVTFAISSIAIGRSGIISSFLLLLIVVVFKINKVSVIFIGVFLLLLTFVTNIIYLIYAQYANNYLVRFDLLQFDTGRDWIWNHYLNEQDLKSIIFGYNMEFDPFFRMLNYNPHNSWINFHANFGMAMLVVSTLGFYYAAKYFRCNKFFAALFIIIGLRAITDNVLFFSMFDFVYYYFFLYFVCWQPNGLPNKIVHLRSATKMA